MSSIIKTGCAPSNTPDGKYFLQTDQACFAELKRGRTYICTAQEEAKVSHYVIITNADFTVTFNGDSDLIQVGRANNAIVMNVHRACRIDFVQGGNLEFKEGTAEFSSRIEMGVNASGNVLVASSLPQQGDFAGQICSLTTGATYVWTGSEWSSTAGSSTLPTPTSSNIHCCLKSTGSAWVADLPAGTIFGQTPTTGSTGTYLIPLYKGTGLYTHFGGDIQFGQHGSTSTKAHVEVTCLGNLVPLVAKTGVTVLGPIVNGGAMFVKGIYYKQVSANVCVYYLGIWASGNAAMRYTMFNRITDSEGLLCDSTDVTLLNDETLLEGTYLRTSVPVSTAANQMLVSDGNGGWKVLAAGAVGTTLKMTSDGPAWST